MVGTEEARLLHKSHCLQVPSTWRPVIEDPTTLQLFLDFYAASKPPLSSMALECLVSTIASCISYLTKIQLIAFWCIGTLKLHAISCHVYVGRELDKAASIDRCTSRMILYDRSGWHQ